MTARIGGLRPGLVIVTGETGQGKGHPLDEVVLTPTGWREVGTLQVGDEVVGSRGQPTKIIGLFPRGVLPVFEVQFSDGVTVRCDADHLWEVTLRSVTFVYKTVLTTRDLAVFLSGTNPPAVDVRNLAHADNPNGDRFRHMQAIVPIGKAEVVCLAVDAPDRLYVTRGYTVTHNTTLTTWLLGDQSADGTPVGLTSFEQSPIGTVQKLLRAVVGGDFGNPDVTDDSIDDAFDILDNRPIHIIDHRGELPFATLLGVVDYMVRRLGVRRLLIDHLGFIVNPETKDERLEIQNVVRKLSIVAEHEGVTIFLICHPSNQHVSQQRRVTLADLKGASAIRQDAHEVWVVTQLQATAKRPPTARIHFDKVRSEYGRAGSYVDLAFDRHACVYADRWEDTPAGRRGQKWEVESDEVSSGVDTVTKGRRPKKKAAEGPTPPPDAPPLFHGNERDYHDTDRE